MNNNNNNNNFLFTDEEAMTWFSGAGAIRNDVEIHLVSDLYDIVSSKDQLQEEFWEMSDKLDDESVVVIAYIQEENLSDIDRAIKKRFDVFHQDHPRPDDLEEHIQ